MFTALEQGIWVKFYDAAGTQLLQKELAQGETYTVPADANGPMIRTARPEALQITIGGQVVPRLANKQMTISDVPVSAAALLARGQAPAAPAAGVVAAASAAPASAPAASASRIGIGIVCAQAHSDARGPAARNAAPIALARGQPRGPQLPRLRSTADAAQLRQQQRNLPPFRSKPISTGDGALRQALQRFIPGLDGMRHCGQNASGSVER